MSTFGKFYLDKEKDVTVSLDMDRDGRLCYTIFVTNHKSDNLIKNLAHIAGCETTVKEGKTMIAGEIPCYIKGDGQRVYIMRLNGTKLANIYPDGRIEVNSVIPAIAKTLMSQTKEYKYSLRETLLKSFVPEKVKLSSDLHTHGNANLDADILIALGIKHQIRYPLYYIKKLGLVLSDDQAAFLDKQREIAAQNTDLSGLSGKYAERRIDDNTFINFADLILNNSENSAQNIARIRRSLTLLKGSQAVFTNLEKLYLYRYVFTKGVPCGEKIKLEDLDRIHDSDVLRYLVRMLQDDQNSDYACNTLYEDTLLWIGREYKRRYVRYVEISDTTLVKKDASAANMLAQVHRILPLVKAETGVDIRFLAAIRRIPLTLVKQDIITGNYLTEAMQALKTVCRDPYVVGSDFVGEEINDVAELKAVIREIVTRVAANDENWTIRIHAGENDSLKSNMARSVELVEQSLLPGQKFPYMRIGHGLYCASLNSVRGKKLLEKIRQNRVVLEFQLSSNVRLNNIIDLHTHPLKAYLQNDIACVMGSDGCGLYGTDSIDEQLALTNFLKITDDEFLKMKAVEDEIIARQQVNFANKMEAFAKACGQNTVAEYYTELLSRPVTDTGSVNFEINKKPSYPVLKADVTELPWDKYPVVIAGGSFAGRGGGKVSESDKALLQTLLDSLDPAKVFFVVGHRLTGQEKYIVDHNKGFDIYSIVPSLMTARQLQRLQKVDITGCRISTESQEMGIYKSFNYEIFERRNCVLFAFDGNSSVANLVQEARNGKGRCWIFAYPKSTMLRAKVDSLDGYVTLNAPARDAVDKICEMQNNIGTRIN